MRRVEEAVAERNQAIHHAPATAEQVHINPKGLTDGEVRNASMQTEHAITTMGQAITAQASREGAPRENLHASTMSSSLRDFTRMNPPVYYGSKVTKDPQEFVEEVHKILCAM